MKTIHKAGIGIAALLLTSYVGFSSMIFLDDDSGTSNERWVPGAASAGQVEAKGLAKGADLATVYSVITTHLDKGEFDQLIVVANEALQTHPKAGQLHYLRGFAHLQKQQIDEAVRDFGTAVDLEPAHADAYRFRAQAYIAKGQLDQALADANTVCELEPKKADSYVIRAMVHLAKGDVEKVKPDVAKVLELDPNNAKAKVLREQIQATAK